MRPRDRTTAILIAATLGVGLALLGSAPRWATCVTALLALAAAVPHVMSRRMSAQRSPLLWLLVTAAALTAVQLIPLPAVLVALIAPAKYAVIADNAAALGHGPPGWIALSYDPPATVLELAKLVAYAALAFACMRVAGSTQGRRWLAHAVVVAGAAMAAVALAHHALGLDALFGIYRPRTPGSTYLAPLLNENHLAGFLALTVPLALVLGLLAGGPLRLLWLGAAGLNAGVALLTQSRGGALALGAGVVLTGALLVVQKRRQPERRERPRPPLSMIVPAGVVAACAVVLLVTFTSGGVHDELAGTSAAELGDADSKFGVWRATTRLVGDNPWTGVGRGGFEVAFTRFHHSGVKTYSHVENEYLQAVVDWGLPAATVLVLLGLWTALVALRRWNQGPLEAGAASALVAIALHNALDFNLELPGVAVAAVAVIAILMPAAVKRIPREQRRRHMAARAAAVLAGAVVVALAASPLGRTVHAEGDALAALLRTPDASHQDAIAEGKRLMARHPSDYLIVGLTAQAYFRARDARAVDVMNRALALNPKHPGLHVLAARMLLAGGLRAQALIEFSLALAHTLEPDTILVELLRFFPDPEEAARGIPTPAERVPVMTNRLTTMRRPDVALAYARRASEENPSNHEILQIISQLALERGEVALAVRAGEGAYGVRRSAPNALAFARALRASGELERARAVIEEVLDGSVVAESWRLVRLHELLADIQAAQGQHRAARDSLRTAISLAGGGAGGSDRHLAGLYTKLARVEQALGNTDLAREAQQRAREHGAR